MLSNNFETTTCWLFASEGKNRCPMTFWGFESGLWIQRLALAFLCMPCSYCWWWRGGHHDFGASAGFGGGAGTTGATGIGAISGLLKRSLGVNTIKGFGAGGQGLLKAPTCQVAFQTSFVRAKLIHSVAGLPYVCIV